ncbi:ROK family transcriptional regulator [Microlunatus parietis]|uniref:Putative NBD/HSP70 family sugar kinase n=1 Tax=Microlunatus parietis TaxID=682979 RepID=A0A7Y9IBB4_9ACTN|nr:ROK family transcriptional regulator [Microlunatus parietis]NYE73493.1 putative NBD/HSP70 family sugar kinase [Microlunatus parietis]
MTGASPGSPAVPTGRGRDSLRDGGTGGRILQALRTSGPATRADLSRILGISRTRVGQVIGELARMNLVTDAPAPHGQEARLGRPGSAVRLRTGLGFVVGVNITHAHVRCLATDLAHVVVAAADEPLVDPLDIDQAIEVVARVVRRVIDKAAAVQGECLGVGLALPAPIDPETLRAAPSSCHQLWVDAPVRELLQARIGLPVYVGNHGNLAVLAERLWGDGHRVDDFIWIGLDTNVGGGICSGGQLLRGRDGFAGELGHIVVDPRGEICRCGNQGCLETVASLDSMQRALRPVYGEVEPSRIFELIGRAEPAALRAITNLGTHVGVAVSTLINILNPSLFIVGGLLSRQCGPVILDAIRTEMNRRALPAARRSVRLQFSALRRPEPLGAAALVLMDTSRHLVIDEAGRPHWT